MLISDIVGWGLGPLSGSGEVGDYGWFSTLALSKLVS